MQRNQRLFVGIARLFSKAFDDRKGCLLVVYRLHNYLLGTRNICNALRRAGDIISLMCSIHWYFLSVMINSRVETVYTNSESFRRRASYGTSGGAS